MLQALLDGESTPAQMAQLAKKRMRQKIPQIELALDGMLQEHHRFILQMQLERLRQLDAHVEKLEARIDDKLQPYHKQRTLLMQIPGVDRIVAGILIAELGTDMTVFHSPRRVAAWTGLCPGNNESAGKRKSTDIRKGNIYLKIALVEAATSASRIRGTYFKAGEATSVRPLRAPTRFFSLPLPHAENGHRLPRKGGHLPRPTR